MVPCHKKEVCVRGLRVAGNYIWCLVMFVVFIGVRRANRWGGGEVLKSSYRRGGASHKRGELTTLDIINSVVYKI